MRDAATVSAMLCPVCKIGLAMSDRQGVEIDYCPQCRGVWLDRGELDKIIERANSADATPRPAAPQPPQQQPPQQPYAQPAPGYPPQPFRGGYDDRQPYGYKKRRKSFLEELFD
ncbi:MAG: zf-TFIIB domain-containing protein [Sphingomonadaceae bacterium]|nr:zf-TFIIB domain-containing protein [Sphingomonadaceae bacterium]